MVSRFRNNPRLQHFLPSLLRFLSQSETQTPFHFGTLLNAIFARIDLIGARLDDCDIFQSTRHNFCGNNLSPIPF